MPERPPTNPTRLDPRRAFTLVELLVTLSIIALLTSLLVAVGSQAMRAREQTLCAANLRSVGMAAWTFAMDRSGALPRHYTGTDAAFDTTIMRTADLAYVNLGQLTAYTTNARVLYCPSQNEKTSPALAYDSKANPLKRDPRQYDSPNGQEPGLDDGADDDDRPGPTGRPGSGRIDLSPGANASYPARSRSDPAMRVVAWSVQNYGNKVIYSDFIGVDGWVGTGRLNGPIHAPHGARGYNRLFGDGSVQWVAADALEALRPIDATMPSPHDLRVYYELLDVLP